MVAVTHDYTPDQQLMVDLYQVIRLAEINKRYYGRRNSCLKMWELGFRIISAVGSSATLLGLLAGFPTFVLILATVAALATTVAPLLGLSERVQRFATLHSAYAQLTAQCEGIAYDVKHGGTVNREHFGLISSAQQQWNRLAALDEESPNQKLVDKIAEDVKRAFPIDRLWMPET